MANCSMGRVKILSLAIVLVLAVVYIQNVEGYRPPQSFFDRILSGASAGCAGKSFYKYADFVQAANAFSGFANTGSLAIRKREVAAFFANVAHETGSLCYIREINRGTYCQSSTKYPCANGVKYYGRGPLQLTWNYNYGAAGDYFNLGLLKNPNIVATNGVVSWKTALWFWMVNSRCHNAITSGHGFGQTIRYINGGECNGGNSAAVTDRVNYYKKFCSWLGVDPGSNLRC